MGRIVRPAMGSRNGDVVVGVDLDVVVDVDLDLVLDLDPLAVPQA